MKSAPSLKVARTGVVELILGEDVAYDDSGALLFCNFGCAGKELPACDRGKGAAEEIELEGPGGVRAGALGDDDVHDAAVLGDRAGGADADDVLHAVEVVQLVAVDSYGRHAHAAAHDGDALAVVIAGEAEHVADVGDEFCVLKVVVGDEFGS